MFYAEHWPRRPWRPTLLSDDALLRHVFGAVPWADLWRPEARALADANGLTNLCNPFHFDIFERLVFRPCCPMDRTDSTLKVGGSL